MAWSVACVLSSVLFPLPLPVLSSSTWTRKSKGKVKAQAFGGFNSAPWPGALAGHQYTILYLPRRTGLEPRGARRG